MKKISIIMMVALAVLFTQCKKTQTITPTNTDDSTRVITVTASLGDGAKTDVNLVSGKIKFTANDMIRYAYTNNSNTRVSGYIPHNDLTILNDGEAISFNITLTNAADNAAVDFFCAYDSKQHNWGFVWSSEGSYWNSGHSFYEQYGTEADIEQRHHLMCGKAQVSDGTINVNLETPIAIAKFDLSGFNSGEDVTVYHGSGNVSFSWCNTDNLSYSFNSPIVLKGVGGNSAVYVTFGEDTNPVTLVFKGATSGMVKYVDFAKILRNKIYTLNYGNSITLTDMPNDFLIGTFSVADGKKVCFAKGNLYYNANTSTWSLKDNQYSITSSWSSTDCGHFYWRDNRNSYFYGATERSVNKLGMDGVAEVDWGRAYNNDNTNITVLTKAEWEYLLNRTDKKGFGTVNGVKGIVLLPDVFRDPYSGTGSEYNNRFTPDGTYAQNTYNLDGWERMEYAGAVFLPVAGCRVGSDNNPQFLSTDRAYYWAKDRESNNGMPYWLYSDGSSMAVEATTTTNPPADYYLGACVRLVYVK